TVLEQNLKLLRFDRGDVETQEKTLFALGKLFFQRRNYRMAATRLEEVLGRVQSGAEALRARLLLGASYRQLASQEKQDELRDAEPSNPETRKFYQAEHRRWLQKAAMEYREVRLALEQPEGRGLLTPREEARVPFLEAECWFDHGGENHRYEEA